MSELIYHKWPNEFVLEAILKFNEEMCDGAGVLEIEAGLHGLDFLTRNSDLDDYTSDRLYWAEVEAKMRISLLNCKEKVELSTTELVKHLMINLEAVRRCCKNILDISRGIDENEIYQHITDRLNRDKGYNPYL